MTDLFQHSIRVIKENQYPSGAYIASPNVDDYAYCWFRDGAFIAYAMDLVGEHDSARRFHQWAVNTIRNHEDVVSRALDKVRQGQSLIPDDVLHTRYTLDSEVGKEEWPNFQLDGFGTWLWALTEHIRASSFEDLPESWEQIIRLVVTYLGALWPYPNYDCWEEFGDKVHPSTLGAIYGGLRAASDVLDDPSISEPLDAIREAVLEKGVREGHLVKYFGSNEVDANLIGISTPYRLLEPDDSIMQATVARIEAELRQEEGGVHRYGKDTYYGGGEWVLLTAWLGWYYGELGQVAKTRKLLEWVEAQASESGDLPEQVPIHLIDPDRLEYWLTRRGEIALPLVWSHAKYLILRQSIG